MSKKILLLSDTHGCIDQSILKHVAEADEVWHAGDIGSTEVLDTMKQHSPLRAVYGNIDDHEIRLEIPETQFFSVDGLSVFIIHIGGYPGRYNKTVKEQLQKHKPQLYICGHSHILKVMRDDKMGLLHINPGAAGNKGFHHMRTMIRFKIIEAQIKQLEVIEIGPRSAVNN